MAEKWIQKAVKKPGALRSSLGAKKLASAAKKPGKLGLSIHIDTNQHNTLL